MTERAVGPTKVTWGDRSEDIILGGQSYVMSCPITAKYENLQGYDVELELDVVAGRICMTAVRMYMRENGRPLSSTALRALPLGELISELTPRLVEEIVSSKFMKRFVQALPPSGGFDIEARTLGSPRGRSISLTPEHLREVASVYRVSVKAGHPPQHAVSTHFSKPQRPVPRSTAARWIMKARELTDPETGEPYLRAAVGSKAGEASPPALRTKAEPPHKSPKELRP